MSDEATLNTEADDIRDVVARELDKLDAPEPASEVAAEETPSDESRARDESGRFKAKEASAPEAAETPQEQPQEQPAPVQEPVRNPFSAWKKEAQTALSQLPPETQSYIIEREKQFHKGIQQYKEDAQRGRSVYSALEPHLEYLGQLQVTPEQAFSKLIETEKALRTGTPEAKAQMLVRLAHDYGIDVGGLTNVRFDPHAYQLEQRLAEQQAMLEQLTQARHLAEQTQLNQTIESFAQSKEHFDTVRETMADLLDKGFASDLDDAYEKAVRLEGLNSVAPAQQSAVFQQNNAAKAAKAAAVSVKGSPVGVTRAPEPKSTEEAVRQAMAKLGL